MSILIRNDIWYYDAKYVRTLKDQVIVCRDKNEIDGSKEYAHFDNHIDLYKYITSTSIYPDASLYEIISEENERKPYLDIEIDITKPSIKKYIDSCNLNVFSFGESLRLEIYNAINNILNSYKYNIIQLESHNKNLGKDKYSLHIIVDGLKLKNKTESLFFRDSVYNIVKNNTDVPSELLTDIIDRHPYSKFQPFRLALCTKKGKNRRLEFTLDNVDHINTVILDIMGDVGRDNDRLVLLNMFLKSCVTYTYESELISLNSPEDYRDKKVNIESLVGFEENALKLWDQCSMKHQYNIRGITDTGSIHLIRNMSGYCDIHHRIHNNVGGYLNKGVDGNLYFLCLGNSICKKNSINIGKISTKIQNLQNKPAYTFCTSKDVCNDEIIVDVIECQKPIIDPTDDIKKYLSINDDQIYTELTNNGEVCYNSNRFPKNSKVYNVNTNNINTLGLHDKTILPKIIMIKSNTRTHKTQSIISLINNKWKDMSILYISTRLVFGDNVVQELINKTKLPWTTHTNGDYNSKYLMCQVESLHKNMLDRDIIIIDEATSVMSQMNSPLHGKNLQLNRSALLYLINNSKHTLFACADLNDLSYDFVSKLTTEYTCDIYINSYHSYSNRKAYCVFDDVKGVKNKPSISTNSHYGITKLLLDKLNKGYKCCAVFSTKQSACKVIKRCEAIGKKCLLIHSSSDTIEKKAFTKNPNKYITDNNIDCLLFTSTLNVGVSITLDHFDYGFAFIHNRFDKTPVMRDVNQMLHRVRNYTSGEIYYSIKSRGQQKHLCTYDNVYNNICTRLEKSDKNTDDLKFNYSTYMLRPGSWKTILDDADPYVHLYIQWLVEKNISNVCADVMFKRILQNSGYNVEELFEAVSKEDLKTWREDDKALSKTIKEDLQKEYIDTLYVTDDNVIENLKKKLNTNTLSNNEKLILDKHRLQTKFDMNKTNEGVVYDNKDNIQQMYNIEIESLSSEEVLVIDNSKSKDILLVKNIYNLKHKVIKEFCDITGFKNTQDRNSKIEFTSDIYNALVEWSCDACIAFSKNKPTLSDNKDVTRLVSTILTEWSCSKLKSTRRYRKGVTFYEYVLIESVKGFDNCYTSFKHKDRFTKFLKGVTYNVSVINKHKKLVLPHEK